LLSVNPPRKIEKLLSLRTRLCLIAGMQSEQGEFLHDTGQSIKKILWRGEGS
jgi:hypothetical protein